MSFTKQQLARIQEEPSPSRGVATVLVGELLQAFYILAVESDNDRGATAYSITRIDADGDVEARVKAEDLLAKDYDAYACGLSTLYKVVAEIKPETARVRELCKERERLSKLQYEGSERAMYERLKKKFEGKP